MMNLIVEYNKKYFATLRRNILEFLFQMIKAMQADGTTKTLFDYVVSKSQVI